MGWKFENYQKKKFICHHSIKKHLCLQQVSLSENLLLASHCISLLWWIFSSLENLCQLSTIITPETMRLFFFVAAAALMERLPLAASYVMATVTMVARASWTQRQMYLCVCEYFLMLWAFYDNNFRCTWNPCSIVLLSWRNIF